MHPSTQTNNRVSKDGYQHSTTNSYDSSNEVIESFPDHGSSNLQHDLMNLRKIKAERMHLMNIAASSGIVSPYLSHQTKEQSHKSPRRNRIIASGMYCKTFRSSLL